MIKKSTNLGFRCWHDCGSNLIRVNTYISRRLNMILNTESNFNGSIYLETDFYDKLLKQYPNF
jgi:hypothetical protein